MFHAVRLLHRAIANGTVAILLCAIAPAAPAWERPHADSANSGFVDVATVPATKAPVTIPDLGTFASGAGPVIAPDGTVFIGNEQGKLMSFRADGARGWSRDITPGQAIVASPVIDAEGSIYVVGVTKMRDHRVEPPVTIYSSTLHKFNSSGAWIFQIPFPQHVNGAATSASPNIWQTGAAEVVMVPAIYADPKTRGFETHLIAFSKDGAILADGLVTRYAPAGDVTGGGGDDIREALHDLTCIGTLGLTCLGGFSGGVSDTPAPPADPADRLPPNTVVPDPGVAILSNPGATPFIVMSDGFQDLVGMTFSGNSFNEMFRIKAKQSILTTPPMILPNGHSIIGSTKGVLFAGPSADAPQPIRAFRSRAAPTRLPDGRVVVVSQQDELLVLQDGAVLQGIYIVGQSMASAAASRTHLFVSMAGGFHTYDAATLKPVAKISWVGGGRSPPAIGPKGHVYAIASNILFVFPPPRQLPGGGVIANPPIVATDRVPPVIEPGNVPTAESLPVATEPDSAPAQPTSQVYKPPVTINGNRLFACEELDQDDCGKGDHKDISLAWCQKEGYSKVKGYDVESRKVKAETLDGRFCSKNKCKVFEEIVCKM